MVAVAVGSFEIVRAVLDCLLLLNDPKIAVSCLATPVQDEAAVDGHCCQSRTVVHCSL